MLPRQYYSEQDMRKRQIDTLKIFNDHVVEVNENSEYRVEFVADGKNMSLIVILGPEFPIEKPSIFVNPPIPHPWVGDNSNQVIGAPGLLNYTLHSDLGRVVQAIIREFQKSMPKFSNSDDGSKSNDASPQSNYSGQSLMFPELNSCCIEELQEILENTDLQDKILEVNPQLIELDLEAEELVNNIEHIVHENIMKRNEMDDMKSEILDRISVILQLKKSFDDLLRKHTKLADLYDPHRIRDCLKEAALKADEESEAIAEQFLTGKIPVETFIAKFTEKRGIGQATRAREERIAYQLAQLDRAENS